MNWKEELLNKLFVEKDITNGLNMYVKKHPYTIFRYRQGNENDINALKNGQIWLANIKNVNDKFEGQLEIIYDKVELNFEFLRDIMKDTVESRLDEMLSYFYLACFSESVLKDTMWSYYANNHKGFCIEYYFDSFESPYFIFPVIYKKTKKIDIDNLDESAMYKNLLTKYSDWSKENEWRIIIPFYDEKTKGKVIKQPIPKAIYMGVDIERDNLEFLTQYCSDNGIELYQMEVDKNIKRLVPKMVL